MSVLIVQLPATPDRESGACLFVQSRDGQSVTHQGHATLAAFGRFMPKHADMPLGNHKVASS